MGCFLFDGVDLAETFEVMAVEMPALAPAEADLRAVPGRDGAVLAGVTVGPLTVKVTARMATSSIDPRDIQREWALAAAPLRTPDPRPLCLTKGRYHMAVLADETPLEFATYSATAVLTFVCPDPVAYGEPRTVTVPSGGSVEFLVGGGQPALPAISSRAVRDATSRVWGLRLDDGDFLHVAPGTESETAIELDCAARTCTVGGSVALPTLDSDWLSLEPGRHVLSMDQGTGAATVTFVERWL